MYLFHVFTIFQIIRGTTPLAGHHSIVKVRAFAYLFGPLIYSVVQNFLFLIKILEARFPKIKIKLFHVLKRTTIDILRLVKSKRQWSPQEYSNLDMNNKSCVPYSTLSECYRSQKKQCL
jgi:hypothetical protein